ncbi:MAG: hypothetical protein HQL46_09955 [Gammaproteobacteria bacterium]|nr:hypothetical protein [Gammaproteobacteria bacterium]
MEKPEEFNILKNSRISSSLKLLFNNAESISFININDIEYLVSQEVVPETGWRLLSLIEKSVVFAPIISLKDLSNKIGIAAIVVMIIFYILFFIYLLHKSTRLSSLIATPIEQLSELTLDLGKKLKSRPIELVGIEEIDNLFKQFNFMANELEMRTNDLIEAKIAADKANDAKSRFLATMSHELRTPLNHIMGFAQLLKDGDEELFSEAVQSITDSGYHLLSIINEILDFSNIDNDGIQIIGRQFEVVNFTTMLFNNMKREADNKDIELSLITSPDVPKIIVHDDLRLMQILKHLVRNAIKFTDPGGYIKLYVNYQDNHLHFSIADSGCGILPEKRTLLFQAFTQLDDSNTRKHGGTGMGLALSKKLVDLMKGEIWFESEYGNGSTFHVKIPFDKVQTNNQTNTYAPLVNDVKPEELQYDYSHEIEPLLPLIQELYNKLKNDNPESCKLSKQLIDKSNNESLSRLFTIISKLACDYAFEDAIEKLEKLAENNSLSEIIC